MAKGDLFFTCDNKSEISEWNSFFAQMIVQDANGNPCLKTFDPNAGGGGVTPPGSDLYSNVEISLIASSVVPIGTAKAVELIVLQGTVDLDNITYPVGVWPIKANPGNTIGTILDYDASNSTKSYLQIMN